MTKRGRRQFEFEEVRPSEPEELTFTRRQRLEGPEPIITERAPARKRAREEETIQIRKRPRTIPGLELIETFGRPAAPPPPRPTPRRRIFLPLARKKRIPRKGTKKAALANLRKLKAKLIQELKDCKLHLKQVRKTKCR